MLIKESNKYSTEMLSGVKGFDLCAYLVGLEGWRRGLKLKYYTDVNQYSDIHTQGKLKAGRSYSFETGNKIHFFNQSRGDLVPNKAVKIANNKHKTKEALQKSAVPILPSYEFGMQSLEKEILKKANEIGFPVVIKPVYGSLSKGVMLNITNEEQLINSLHYLKNELGYKSVLLEKYFEGEDIRAYVVNGKVVAALRRIPAKITGNGKSTIKQLIHNKNKTRMNNPYLAARPIKIDNELKEAIEKEGYVLDDKLESGKTILVKKKSTLTQGVDLYDITEKLSDRVAMVAINACNAIPGLIHGSIDMLFDGKDARVIEVNASANISMHMFPTEGKARNVGSHLMDLYFPETKSNVSRHTNVYFDFVEIMDILKNNFTNYIELNPLPIYPLKTSKYTVTGKLKNVYYKTFIRRKAREQNVHGYAKTLENGRVEILAAHESEGTLANFEKICRIGSKRSRVDQVIKDEDCTDEIKLGFRLI